eukprot:TRINITY_DN7141_c0_g1_i1.p1 TRINITY_DN7141_c0_g1~~TRINITY_DN7141_c0_g1_i1.p1  ORF type:complete len:158 (+),score=52.26 TRINITY_DN7141_c0_g1_i1:28-474(+)
MDSNLQGNIISETHEVIEVHDGQGTRETIKDTMKYVDAEGKTLKAIHKIEKDNGQVAIETKKIRNEEGIDLEYHKDSFPIVPVQLDPQVSKQTTKEKHHEVERTDDKGSHLVVENSVTFIDEGGKPVTEVHKFVSENGVTVSSTDQVV